MPVRIHAADLVLPLAGPPVAHGAVAVSGDRVVDVGEYGQVRHRHPDAPVRRHRGLLLPGLVNAHAHLEYGPPFADLASSGLPFPRWITELTLRRRAMDPVAWLAAARGSVHQMVRSGTTAVADIVTAGPGLLAASRAGLVGISYVEAVGADEQGWPAERARVVGLLEGAPRPVGVSPHALYSLGTSAFRGAVELARERGLRLHPHLAETADEAEWVLSGTGAIGRWMERVGLSLELAGVGSGVSPVRHCDDLGGLGADVHVAHGVHVDSSDRALLRERQTVVALCTRSNAILRAGAAPVAAYLAEGNRVALGTDSLASSPDLDLLAEARATRDLALEQGAGPEGLAEKLVRAATQGGAAALGRDDVGVLRPGARADLAVFDVPVGGPDPYASLLEHGPGRCTATVLGGRLVHRAH